MRIKKWRTIQSCTHTPRLNYTALALHADCSTFRLIYIAQTQFSRRRRRVHWPCRLPDAQASGHHAGHRRDGAIEQDVARHLHTPEPSRHHLHSNADRDMLAPQSRRRAACDTRAVTRAPSRALESAAHRLHTLLFLEHHPAPAPAVAAGLRRSMPSSCLCTMPGLADSHSLWPTGGLIPESQPKMPPSMDERFELNFFS